MKNIKMIICCTLILGYSAAIAQDIQVIMKVLDLNSSDGDSDIPGYLGSDGWFKVDSYSSGIFNPAEVTSTISPSKTGFNAMAIQMPHNALRTTLYERMTAGVRLDDVVIHAICTACTGQNNNQPVLTTELKEPIIQNINFAPLNPLQYEVILLYGAVRRSYPVDATPPFVWSVVKNKPEFSVQ